MRLASILRPLGLVLAMLATQGGCDPNARESNARLLTYTLTGEERAIDPETGETVITSHWQYEDGYNTTTIKRIPRGNEERQSDLRPAPRVVD